MRTLQCITLHQPWASWIALGWKSIETRTHRSFACLQGKHIGIHAGNTWDRLAYIKAADIITQEQVLQTEELRTVHGVILCTAFVKEVRPLTKADSRAAMCNAQGLFGLVLEDVQHPILDTPIVAKGKQGIWSFNLPF
jgi:hypothetical protein